MGTDHMQYLSSMLPYFRQLIMWGIDVLSYKKMPLFSHELGAICSENANGEKISSFH